MKVVAVVQARTASTRLPGKVLADLGGIPMLTHVLRRLRAARRVDEVVLATTVHERDDALVELARTEGVAASRGPEADVLGRIREAAATSGADAIVRITGDCPLLDPEVVDRVVEGLLEDPGACDYASNVIRRTYPKGLDAEALWWDTLARIDRLARSPQAREHVTWFAYRERPELFLLRSIETENNYSDLDWSVDTQDDLDRVRALLESLDAGNRPVPWKRVLERERT